MRDIVRNLEREWEHELGTERFAQLRLLLTDLNEHLAGPDPHPVNRHRRTLNQRGLQRPAAPRASALRAVGGRAHARTGLDPHIESGTRAIAMRELRSPRAY
jgi:hypothetical protein